MPKTEQTAKAKRPVRTAPKANKAAPKQTAPEATTTAPAPVASAPAPAFVSSYAGPSKALNTARGKRERLDRTYVPGSFTYRDDAFLRDLIAQYARNPFSTNALDKKQCERLHGAGVLAFVSADDDTMRVTDRGANYAARTSPASNGSKPVALSAIN